MAVIFNQDQQSNFNRSHYLSERREKKKEQVATAYISESNLSDKMSRTGFYGLFAQKSTSLVDIKYTNGLFSHRLAGYSVVDFSDNQEPAE